MKIKIYINWDDGIVLTEKGFDEWKNYQVKNIVQDEFERNGRASDFFCDKNINVANILFMNMEEIEKLRGEFYQYLKENAIQGDDFSVIELDV